MYKPHLYVATPMYGGMCCGAYTQSIINLVTACNQNGIDVSFSFMFNESLIQRQVFDTIKEKLDIPAYSNDVVDLGGNLKGGDKITAFFDVSMEEGTGRLLSEDYHFCQLYRKAGGQVWVAPWVKLAHIGTYIFEGGFIPAD